MKNLFIYYVVILLPLAVLIWVAFLGYYLYFGIGILIYALLYRPLTDGLRLVAKGKIKKQEIGKAFIPFWTVKWFKSLYFSK
ncbi:MAG TPA: hypothetical protein VK179_01220 [Bacteroidales bacterium]|nr:hypothetical protein [Bacteroidales bacterium]